MQPPKGVLFMQTVPTEEELSGRAMSGDREAFAELFTLFRPVGMPTPRRVRWRSDCWEVADRANSLTGGDDCESFVG